MILMNYMLQTTIFSVFFLINLYSQYYGSEEGSFHSALDVERVQLLFCKRVLHTKRSNVIYFIYGDLGRFPLQITSKLRIL